MLICPPVIWVITRLGIVIPGPKLRFDTLGGFALPPGQTVRKPPAAVGSTAVTLRIAVLAVLGMPPAPAKTKLRISPGAKALLGRVSRIRSGVRPLITPPLL